jgi:Chain length determinant protein
VTAVRERDRDLPELDAERDVDLRRHWDTITTHWWLPVAGLVAGIIVGYLISLGGAQVYRAKATVYLGQPLSQGGVQVQSQATNPSTVRQIVTAESTIQAVAKKVGMRPGQLRGHISTQAVTGNISRLGQNPLVAINVTGHERRKVARAANNLAATV